MFAIIHLKQQVSNIFLLISVEIFFTENLEICFTLICLFLRLILSEFLKRYYELFFIYCYYFCIVESYLILPSSTNMNSLINKYKKIKMPTTQEFETWNYTFNCKAHKQRNKCIKCIEGQDFKTKDEKN